MKRWLRSEDGAAIVEFVLLAAVLLVPVIYLVITAATVQRASFAVTSAVRDAGRAYVTADSDAAGRSRATTAAALALADAHVPFVPSDLIVDCAPRPCTFAPGSQVTVTLHVAMPLPGLPQLVCGHGCPIAIPVTAHHSEHVGCFRMSDVANEARSCAPG